MTDSTIAHEKRRRIPSMERLLSSGELAPLIATWGRDAVKNQLSSRLAELRSSPRDEEISAASLAADIAPRLAAALSMPLRRLLNGTGVIIHTNLGRSPVGSGAWDAAGALVTRYTNLELDLESGKRGRREEHVGSLARRLFGCEAALLVNNNAAAVLLVLAAIAHKREVIVSRGELVEIGGRFRIPEVIVQGGAKLREVGTTNRTRASDFENAIGKKSGAILRVHQSNYRIVGFTEQPQMEELSRIAREHEVPMVIDEGSGRAVDLAKYGLASAPTVKELLEGGADVVTCSTDKLLGATQGGLILGRAALVGRCAKHPLMRAFRAGKETHAVVASSLLAFLTGTHEERIPIYRMLATSVETLLGRAGRISKESGNAIIETRSAVGGGTTPTETLPSIGIAVDGEAQRVQQQLLGASIPVIGRIIDDRFTVDLRTISPDEDSLLIAALRSLRAPS
jgi:L-seryl-tRNA(Ser) seleniumtransferase